MIDRVRLQTSVLNITALAFRLSHAPTESVAQHPPVGSEVTFMAMDFDVYYHCTNHWTVLTR